MGWPKGKKKGVDGKVVDSSQPEEQLSRPATVVEAGLSEEYICKTCGHSQSMHYDGRDRQCNTSGCACQKVIR